MTSFLRRVHLWLTTLWLVLAVPSVLFWRHSVAWLVVVSVYANVAGHWAAWQAARHEDNSEGGE